MSSTTTVTTEQRIKALAEHLAEHLAVPVEDIEATKYQPGADNAPPVQFEAMRGEYLVLTEAEADKMVEEKILDDVWAFKPEFVVSHLKIDLPAHRYDRFVKVIKKVQEDLCEDANDLLRPLLKDEKEFVEDAVSADGRGHFLSGYDGEDNDVRVDGVTLYVYRVN